MNLNYNKQYFEGFIVIIMYNIANKNCFAMQMNYHPRLSAFGYSLMPRFEWLHSPGG